MARHHLIHEGIVEATTGVLVRALLPGVSLGDECSIQLSDFLSIPGQVVGFDGALVWIAPVESAAAFRAGMKVTSYGRPLSIDVGPHLLGEVIDPTGKLLDGEARPSLTERRALHAPPPEPLSRKAIDTQLVTGLRVLDSFVPLGCGQRIGVFAPAGVGKSTLLGCLARYAQADVVVVALVGERGREVKDFLDENFPAEMRNRAVIVVATSNESALRRAQAPITATTIAEYFRDKGLNVLLLVDSLTRTARALREIGLAAGESLVRGGYTPSVYARLPTLLERAGASDRGTITALYTMLTERDESDDPLAEEIKSLLDGHISLSAEFASQGIYPAVDPLRSLSRLTNRFQSTEERNDASIVRRALSRLRRDRDLVLFGGTPDPELAAALTVEPEILKFLSQSTDEQGSRGSTMDNLASLARRLEEEGRICAK